MTAMAYPHQWRGPAPWEKRCARMGHHRRHGNRAWGPGGPGPGFGPGFGPPFGPRGRRAARGDVRAAVLLLLAEEPRNGYALMQEIEERSEGAWRPSPGSIYPALAQLEDEGLVEATKEGSGREFALTDAGREHVEARRDELGEPWKAVSGGFPKEAGELRELMMQLGAAAMQVVSAGTAEQRKRAVELLTETRRGLYGILASDEDSGEE
jgi:DNA-binding PadR family transcriptional regulator